MLHSERFVDSSPAQVNNSFESRCRQRIRSTLTCFAAGLRLDAQAVISDGDVLGRMLDTFVVAQLRPEAVVAESEPRLYHLRTTTPLRWYFRCGMDARCTRRW